MAGTSNNQVVLLVAVVAVARKVIVMDFEK